MTIVDSRGTLATARALWQLGEWDALRRLPIRGASERSLQELLLIKLHAQTQKGSREEIEQAMLACASAGVSREAVERALVSSAFNCLGKIEELTSDRKGATDFEKSVELYPAYGTSKDIGALRRDHQIIDIIKSGAPMRYSKFDGLFIDCGGYDGCSSLQFLMKRPHFDCVTFEPNPELWRYYRGLPTRLIKKAVYTYTGKVIFTIDPVDQDGSSVIPSKRIDYDRTVSNDDCPRIEVPCINLSSFVRRMSRRYRSIVLKLDIEGAEYEILEMMLDDGTIDIIDTLYCEFHVGKMDVSSSRHTSLVTRLKERVSVHDWDALPWSFLRKETRSTRSKRKHQLVRSIMRNRIASESLFNVQATFVEKGG